MKKLTIQAAGAESASSLFRALSEFDPELDLDPESGHLVTVRLGGDRQTLAVLDVLNTYVAETHSGDLVRAIRFELDGRPYTVHA